jgi:RHS repeat-associated protein
VTHGYVYDSAGRLAYDSVTNWGGSGVVDENIQCIGTKYDDLGRVKDVTSYSAVVLVNGQYVGEEGNEANQVEYAYDGWGNVSKESEAHSGVVTGATPSVQYSYADGAGANHKAAFLRLADVIYPTTSRKIGYNYGENASATDYIMSRLTSLFDDTDADGLLDTGTETVEASYKYMGLGTVVEEKYDVAGIRLTYLTGDSVTGLDKFGRIHEQVWKDASDGLIDDYLYTYDHAGNVTNKANQLHHVLDETLTYDALSRLASTKLGNNSNPYQAWTLDAQGNWSNFQQDQNSDGTLDLDQQRAANSANELDVNNNHADNPGDSIGATTGANWLDPTYDAAGNMTSAPKTGDEAGTRLYYKYDAWNRQAGVYADAGLVTQIATYHYDGANRRVEKVVGGGATTEFFYNQQWQLLEEKVTNGATVTNQYVWSPRYVDSPIVRFSTGAVAAEYYTSDANHNVTAMVSASGSVVQRVAYDDYGKATAYTGNWSSTSSVAGNGPLYCGYWLDAETGNDLARNRYYNVALATWISRDPIGYSAGDPNLYRYCGDMPTIYTDPTGTIIWPSILNAAQDAGGVRRLPPVGPDNGTIKRLPPVPIFPAEPYPIGPDPISRQWPGGDPFAPSPSQPLIPGTLYPDWWRRPNGPWVIPPTQRPGQNPVGVSGDGKGVSVKVTREADGTLTTVIGSYNRKTGKTDVTIVRSKSGVTTKTDCAFDPATGKTVCGATVKVSPNWHIGPWEFKPYIEGGGDSSGGWGGKGGVELIPPTKRRECQ